MTDLGSLGFGVSSGFGINAGGEVAGISYTNKTVQVPCDRHICTVHIADPFSWAGGKMTDLGTLGGTFSEGLAVNSSGDIVGDSNGEAFLVHNGKMTDLGPGMATGINDFGEIAGTSQHAFVISGGKQTTLPDLSNYGGGISGTSGISRGPGSPSRKTSGYG